MTLQDPSPVHDKRKCAHRIDLISSVVLLVDQTRSYPTRCATAYNTHQSSLDHHPYPPSPPETTYSQIYSPYSPALDYAPDKPVSQAWLHDDDAQMSYGHTQPYGSPFACESASDDAPIDTPIDESFDAEDDPVEDHCPQGVYQVPMSAVDEAPARGWDTAPGVSLTSSKP